VVSTCAASCAWRPRCLQQFHAQRGRPRGDLLALAHDMGLQQSVLNQQWSELSVRRAPQRAWCGPAVVCACPASVSAMRKSLLYFSAPSHPASSLTPPSHRHPHFFPPLRAVPCPTKPVSMERGRKHPMARH